MLINVFSHKTVEAIFSRTNDFEIIKKQNKKKKTRYAKFLNSTWYRTWCKYEYVYTTFFFSRARMHIFIMLPLRKIDTFYFTENKIEHKANWKEALSWQSSALQCTCSSVCVTPMPFLFHRAWGEVSKDIEKKHCPQLYASGAISTLLDHPSILGVSTLKASSTLAAFFDQLTPTNSSKELFFCISDYTCM